MTLGRKSVIISDSQPAYRLGLATLVARAHPTWDIADTDRLDKLRPSLDLQRVDLLILESRTLVAGFMQGTPIQNHSAPGINIIAITEQGDYAGALGCKSAGAHATISRAASAASILTEIETIAASRDTPVVVDLQTTATATVIAKNSEISQLTVRQRDVLRSLAKGQSNKSIARDLEISVSMVKVHLATLFRSLGVRNRMEALIVANPG
jgi:two-component system nitrate/nitrite response regulator NarL